MRHQHVTVAMTMQISQPMESVVSVAKTHLQQRIRADNLRSDEKSGKMNRKVLQSAWVPRTTCFHALRGSMIIENLLKFVTPGVTQRFSLQSSDLGQNFIKH